MRRVGTVAPAEKMKIARHLSELEGETPFGYSRDETTNGCAFHRKCWEVLSGHSGIHAAHFDHKWDRCFCSSCMGSRGDRPTYSGGSHGPGTCKIAILSRFVALSVSLTQKVSLFQ